MHGPPNGAEVPSSPVDGNGMTLLEHVSHRRKTEKLLFREEIRFTEAADRAPDRN